MLEISDYSDAAAVFHFFEEISKIPHGSGNTSKIADYLVNFATERRLFVKRDKFDNVIIRKRAYKGYEGRPAIILQGHTDMVAEKVPDLKKDMRTEGLDIYRDGDFIRARGTTLGGDDGVAIAYALAILDSDDIPHPELEAVFTTDEETGLTGAVELDAAVLKGKAMINIDSDVEGVFTVGCAGGVRVDIELPAERKTAQYGNAFRITVDGLKGGHSGVEIDKGRENAIKILGEILSAISEQNELSIASIEGGNADNAIPRRAVAIISAGTRSKNEIFGIASKILSKYALNEEKITVQIEDVEGRVTFFADADSRKLLSLLASLPSGVVAMSEEIPGLVETSLNLGIIRTNEKCAKITFSIRSSKGVEKEALVDRVSDTAHAHGAEVSLHGDYPAWEYRAVSPLRDIMCDVYERMYNKAPEVITIHAGLECGIFSNKIDGFDCVSIGPDNFDIHTTEEHLSISSTARVFDYLKEVLRNI